MKMTELTRIGKKNLSGFRHLMPGQEPGAEVFAIGALYQNRAAGCALLSAEEDSLSLDWLYVADAFRRKGVGTTLLKGAEDLAIASGAASLHALYPSTSHSLEPFLKSGGYFFLSDGVHYRVKTKDCLASELLRADTHPGDVMPLSALTGTQKKHLGQRLEEAGPGAELLREGICDETLSLAALDGKTGEAAAALIAEAAGNEVFIHYLVNFSGQPERLVTLFRAFSEQLQSLETLPGYLVFAGDDTARKLAEKMSGKKLKPEGEYRLAGKTLHTQP